MAQDIDKLERARRKGIEAAAARRKRVPPKALIIARDVNAQAAWFAGFDAEARLQAAQRRLPPPID